MPPILELLHCGAIKRSAASSVKDRQTLPSLKYTLAPPRGTDVTVREEGKEGKKEGTADVRASLAYIVHACCPRATPGQD